MSEELLKEVKIRLRSLVVSSPTQVDSRTLMRDYVKLLGSHIPLSKMGYRDFVTFLRERCSDSFLLSGPPSNPILTVIVPDSAKHIDHFVKRSKLPSTAKVKTKRGSIPEARVNPSKQDLIYNSFFKHTPSTIEEPQKVEVKAPDIIANHNKKQNKENFDHHKNGENLDHHKNRENVDHHKNRENVDHQNNRDNVDPSKNTAVTSNDVKNFLKKRLPVYDSFHELEEALSEVQGPLSISQDDDSGKHTSSSTNSTKARQFEELKSELMELISAAPEGVWCTDLIRLYRERFHRELNFTRFGYTSIISLAYALEARVQITRPVDTGDWLLAERSRAARAPAALRVWRARLAPPPARAAPAAPAAPLDDDALPGIDFDPDVFPADCVRFMEQIPGVSLADVRPGAMLEVMVGEVYSPSHFWLIRLGDQYNIAMEDLMDEMTAYYNGEGRSRALSRGAVRVGHYCASLYENDWHRSVIVKIVDSDTVKVRHVDYGTVETVSVSGLRALRRVWARLPAQAVRARLAGVRPSACGRRWPHAAAAHFLRRVQCARLVANVVAVDAELDALETLLIDTRGAADVCLSAELIRAGHADARADSALRTAECYLYPRFEALEGGDTPNLAEIHAYLRDGIALDYVEAYRRHVPACLPAPPSPPEPPAPPEPAHDSDDATLHELYAAESPPEPELYAAEPPPEPELYAAEPPPEPELYAAEPPPEPELATRIPLLWPPAPPARPASPPPSPAPAPELPPPPARTPPARAPPACSTRAPKTPVRDARSPAAAVSAERPVKRQSAINPEAQVFTPRLFPLPPGLPPPPGALPAGQWFGPYSAPGVTLSLAECDTYRALARLNPDAAHWYMAGALGRAMAAAPVRPVPHASFMGGPGAMGGPGVMGGPGAMGGPGVMGGPGAMGGPGIMGCPGAMGGPSIMGCPGAMGGPGIMAGPGAMGGPGSMAGPGAMGGPGIMGGPGAMGGPGSMAGPGAMGGPGNMAGPGAMGGPGIMGGPGAMGTKRPPPGFGT